MGFFSLAVKNLYLPDDTSNSLRRKIDSKDTEETICYLIGQVGRSDKYTSDDLPGSYILKLALDHIKSAQELIGGRTVLIECEDNNKLINFYKNNGFRILPAYTLEEFVFDDIINLIPNDYDDIRKTIKQSIENIAVERYDQLENDYVKLIKII